MGNIIFYEDMFKEKKIGLLFIFLTFVGCVYIFFSGIYVKGEIIFSNLKYLFLFLFAFFVSIYYFVYAINYKVIISDGEIIYKTLFSKKRLKVENIVEYDYKKDSPISSYYRFNLITKEGTYKICVKQKDTFIKCITD